MESNEREAKLKASSHQRATHGQMDDAYQPIRARALLTLCYNVSPVCNIPKFARNTSKS